MKSERSEINSPLSSSQDEDDMDFTDKYPDLPDSDSEDEEIDPGSHADELKLLATPEVFPQSHESAKKPSDNALLPPVNLDTNRLPPVSAIASTMLPPSRKESETLQ